MLKTNTVQNTLIALSLVTTLGVFMHESKLDQASTVALALPLGMTLALGSADAIPKLKSDGHPHVERAMLDRTTRKGNIIPPRTNRKHMLPKPDKDFNALESHTLVLSPSQI